MVFEGRGEFCLTKKDLQRLATPFQKVDGPERSKLEVGADGRQRGHVSVSSGSRTSFGMRLVLHK